MHCFLARYGINTATTQQCFPLRLFAGRAPSEKVPGLRKKRLWEPVAAAFGQLFPKRAFRSIGSDDTALDRRNSSSRRAANAGDA